MRRILIPAVVLAFLASGCLVSTFHVEDNEYPIGVEALESGGAVVQGCWVDASWTGNLEFVRPDGTVQTIVDCSFSNAAAAGPAVAPDGTVYFGAEANLCPERCFREIRSFDPASGQIETVYAFTEADDFYFKERAYMAIGPSGDIYFGARDISTSTNFNIYRLADGSSPVPVPGTDCLGYTGFDIDDEENIISASGCDNAGDVVLQIDAAGNQTVVAGTPGSPGFSGDGGPATEAQLAGARGVDMGAHGVLYIADRSNRRIRAVGGDGVIRTVAGTGGGGCSADGSLAARAEIGSPLDVDAIEGQILMVSQFGACRGVRKIARP